MAHLKNNGEISVSAILEFIGILVLNIKTYEFNRKLPQT